MKLPHKTLEKNLFKSGYGYIYAVDEVGMGCLAGPVVVCAVGMTNHFYNKHHKKLIRMRESKLLSSQQREKFAEELLKEKDLVYAIAQCSPKIIDKLNIYQASRLAMRNAIKKINPPYDLKTITLVDGNKKIPNLKGEQMPIVKGDRKVFAIACASVIAKVFRDKLMDKYSKKYPGYGFEKHKGYGTKYHQVQLVALGTCAIHRKSFAPVGKLI
ncbi:MAG: Ribonuclease HII [Candidatus Yanofskybacteria bacterium GW2011_GWA1_39_13]|uniref:Ribonuclease n=1 Tax=Yanofskybacteria sp. (strain GW2011_GWA1_39_13) TaxID=1619019 RepID=A0A0G0PW67_YANXG|nr:MAG: Ribonuclease HII [Candidatus Yanofskybacteria bacterium GW2011_GWA1_39_13]